MDLGKPLALDELLLGDNFWGSILFCRECRMMSFDWFQLKGPKVCLFPNCIGGGRSSTQLRKQENQCCDRFQELTDFGFCPTDLGYFKRKSGFSTEWSDIPHAKRRLRSFPFAQVSGPAAKGRSSKEVSRTEPSAALFKANEQSRLQAERRGLGAGRHQVRLVAVPGTAGCEQSPDAWGRCDRFRVMCFEASAK